MSHKQNHEVGHYSNVLMQFTNGLNVYPGCNANDNSNFYSNSVTSNYNFPTGATDPSSTFSIVLGQPT